MNRILGVLDKVLSLFAAAPASMAPPLPQSPRILISQPGHLGDLVIATSLIDPLRSMFPGCRLGFLVASWASPVLVGHPAIDSFHVFDHALLNRGRDWGTKIARHRQSRRTALVGIRSDRYDLAIELSFNFPNNIPLLRAAGIPIRIGYTSGGFGPLLTHPVRWQHHPEWSVMRYHGLLLDRAAAAAAASLAASASRSDVRRSRLVVAPSAIAGTPLPSRYTVIHMGSGGPLKEWPAERWSGLVDGLIARGRTLVFTGSGNHESALVAAIVRGRSACIDLCSKLDWPAFVGVVAQAQEVVAVDSAAGHVAAAFDIPSVTLGHGMTDPELYRPQSSVNRAIRREVPCLPCYRSRGCPSMDCIRGVTASQVLEVMR